MRSALLVRPNDDRGSIPMLALVMIATAALGAVMLTVVISQDRTSRFDQTRIHGLHAAQTGIDVALGSIRAATMTDPVTSEVTGDDAKLPCGPWTGNSDGRGVSNYSTTIAYYYRKPPSGAMNCTAAGPYIANNGYGVPSRTPHFAVITSLGCDGPLATSNGSTVCRSGSSAGRRISTIYVFKTNDMNITGGQIMIYPAGSDHYCMDAGDTPTTGTAVLTELCSTSVPPDPGQVWEYRQDLSIELAASANANTPLCLDTGASPTAHNGGDAIVLEPCKVTDVTTRCPSGTTPTQYAAAHPGQSCVTSPMCPAGMTPTAYTTANPGLTCSVSPWNQQWSVDDSAHLRGANTSQSDVDGFCINTSAQAPDLGITIQPCAGGVSDTQQTWVPSATAGAGMAGANNQQLVNFQMFATCLDVTGQDVNASSMILYTCKQNPNPTKVLWNQKFIPSPALTVAPARTLLTVVKGGQTYCLYSPDNDGGYPRLSPAGGCPSSVTAAPAGYVWTVSQFYSNAAGTVPLPYANRYTIKDDTGLCLAPGPNTDLYNAHYLRVIVTACSGGTEQKWNANASLGSATLIDTHEMGAPTG